MTGQVLSSAGGAIVSSDLETGGGWNNISFDNDSWSEHLTAGAAAGVNAGMSYGSGKTEGLSSNMRSDMLGQMVTQGINTAAIKLSGGKGFSDEFIQRNRNYNWNAMAPDASKLGSMIGGMAGEYLNKSRADYDQRKKERENSPQVPGGADPLVNVETLLGGLWYGMDKAKEYAGEIMSGISNFGGDMINDFGLNDEISAITGTVTGAYNTAAGYVNSFADITRGMVADLDEFADRTGNLVTGDGFNTNKEVTDVKVARYKELLNNPTLMAANGGSSAGLDAEAMAWKNESARADEMNQLAKELGISPEMNLKLQQQAITGNQADYLNKQIADTWKTGSAKEVNALLKELAKVNPEAAKQWNGYFKGVRDTESALAYQKQLNINSSLREAELGTHAEANAIYAQQNIQGGQINPLIPTWVKHTIDFSMTLPLALSDAFPIAFNGPIAQPISIRQINQ